VFAEVVMPEESSSWDMAQFSSTEMAETKTDEIQMETKRIARLGDRIVASVLDLMALFPVFPLIMFGVALRVDAIHDGNFELHGGPALVAISLIGLLWIMYYIIGEGAFDGTFGKHIMGLRVMSVLNSPVTFSEVVIRNVLRPLDAIGLYLVGFIVALVSKDHQRIGDIAGGTIVCEYKTRRGISMLLWFTWLVVVFACCLVMQHFAANS
jgi:uncharacterized RDD family membrane protein YckC